MRKLLILKIISLIISILLSIAYLTCIIYLVIILFPIFVYLANDKLIFYSLCCLTGFLYMLFFVFYYNFRFYLHIKKGDFINEKA